MVLNYLLHNKTATSQTYRQHIKDVNRLQYQQMRLVHQLAPNQRYKMGASSIYMYIWAFLCLENKSLALTCVYPTKNTDLSSDARRTTFDHVCCFFVCCIVAQQVVVFVACSMNVCAFFSVRYVFAVCFCIVAQLCVVFNCFSMNVCACFSLFFVFVDAVFVFSCSCLLFV